MQHESLEKGVLLVGPDGLSSQRECVQLETFVGGALHTRPAEVRPPEVRAAVDSPGSIDRASHWSIRKVGARPNLHAELCPTLD